MISTVVVTMTVSGGRWDGVEAGDGNGGYVEMTPMEIIIMVFLVPVMKVVFFTEYLLWDQCSVLV